MTDTWLRRPAASAVLLTALGLENGADPRLLLQGTGLDLAGLHAPDTELDASQELRLVRNLVAAVPVPGLGFVAGHRYHLGVHPEWSYAVLTSRTLRDAIEVGLAFAELTYTFSKVRLRERNGRLHAVVDDSHVPAGVRRFLLERDLAAFATTALAVGGSHLIEAADLAVPAPEDPRLRAAYAEALGLEPRWDRAEHAFVCPVADLARPLADFLGPDAAEGATAARRACTQRLDRRRRAGGFTGQVRQSMLAASPAVGQAEIAAGLHVSLRTLRRRLAAEGTTYRELAQEVWSRVAEELLAGGLTVEQVADRLGYAGPSSFTRAFKSWKGTSPGTFGRRSRETAPERATSTL